MIALGSNYVDCTKIMCMDLAGNVPKVVMSKMTAKQMEGHWPTADYILNGRILEPF